MTPAELETLCSFTVGARVVIEVGVSEGATSASLLAAMPSDADLYLVDPYLEGLRLEALLGFSGTAHIARRAVRRFGERAHFVRKTSRQAAADWPAEIVADLIFVDARHDYDSVTEDLALWSRALADGGRIAVHDCLPCAGRPELRVGEGGCRAVAEALHAGWRTVASAESLAVLEPVRPPLVALSGLSNDR